MASRVFIGQEELRERAARLIEWAGGSLDMAHDEETAVAVLELDAVPTDAHSGHSRRVRQCSLVEITRSGNRQLALRVATLAWPG